MLAASRGVHRMQSLSPDTTMRHGSTDVSHGRCTSSSACPSQHASKPWHETRRQAGLNSAGRARSGLRSHQRLELVLAWCQGHAVDQHVPPDVTCCVLRAVDPDEGALTVISMHPEVKSAAEA